MTVVRDGDRLTLVNTLRLDDAGLAALEALGTVQHVVKLGSFHGRDDAFYVDRYGATVWAIPGMPHERGVSTGVELTPGGPMPCEGADVFVFETSSLPESLLLLERSGGVLIACDSLQNMVEPDEFFDEASAAMMGGGGFFRPGGVGPGWRNSASPAASDFSRVQALPYRHLLSAHGTPLIDDAHAVLGATFAELYGV